jgi:hypothetical protein
MRHKMRDKKQILVVLLLAVLGAALALTSAFASATPDVGAGTPVVGATEAGAEASAFTGPVMTSASAVQFAVQAATRAGDSSPTEMTQMAGTFAETQAVMSGGNGGRMLESPETAEWFKSAAYLTVMHGHFTSTLVAPGTTPVKGTVLSVITDAHNGWVEGESLGQAAPSSSALGAVTAPTVGGESVAPTAGNKATIASNEGVLTGRLTHPGQPLIAPGRLPSPDSQVVVGQGQLPLHIVSGRHAEGVVATSRTGSDGQFTFHLKPGRYLVAGVVTGGVSSHSTVCPSKHVTVDAGKRATVEIGC